MNLDKPLPTSLEEERLVLGAIMAKGIDGYAEVADSISASSFYFSANRHIFAAIEEAVKRGVDCDLTVVQTILRERNLLDEVGGPLYLTDSLTCALPSSLTFHALELNNLCARRELILRSAKITESAYDTSNKLEDVLDEAQKAITAVGSTIGKCDTDRSTTDRSTCFGVTFRSRQPDEHSTGTGASSSSFSAICRWTTLVAHSGSCSQLAQYAE